MTVTGQSPLNLDQQMANLKGILLQDIRRSVYVYRVDRGGCNGCEIEILTIEMARQRALPRTILSNQGYFFARLDHQRDVIQDFYTARVGEVDMVNLDQHDPAPGMG